MANRSLGPGDRRDFLRIAKHSLRQRRHAGTRQLRGRGVPFTWIEDRQEVFARRFASALVTVEITDEAFYGARNYWYGLMGWTEEGVPTSERVTKLGLDELLDGIKVPTV